MMRPALQAVPAEQDQAARMARFRQRHPGVPATFGTGFWQATVPEANGETVITRYTGNPETVIYLRGAGQGQAGRHFPSRYCGRRGSVPAVQPGPASGQMR